MLALALAMPAASAQVPEDLIGIHTRITTIGPNVGFLKAGEKVTNELIVYADPDAPGQLKSYVSSVATNGISCSAHGKVGDIAPSGFTVSDNLLGGACTITTKREKDGLKIAKDAQCRGFCGFGGSFARAEYRKVCGTVSADVVSDLETRTFAINPDYGPACSARN